MKKSGIIRTCPRCGRSLETVINRFGVECWPQHKEATEKTVRSWSHERIMKEFRLPEGDRAWDVQCLLSSQPIDLGD